MTEREKRLLTFFGVAGFLVLNFVGHGFYQSMSKKLELRKRAAKAELKKVEEFRSNRDRVAAEMDWLVEHPPVEGIKQEVQNKLQQYCDQQAKSMALECRSKPLPTDESDGLRYHRVKMEFTLKGTEDALYRWLDRINIPEQTRMTTRVRMSPNPQDDTKIDCTATVEQWFTPVAPSDEPVNSEEKPQQ